MNKKRKLTSLKGESTKGTNQNNIPTLAFTPVVSPDSFGSYLPGQSEVVARLIVLIKSIGKELEREAQNHTKPVPVPRITAPLKTEDLPDISLISADTSSPIMEVLDLSTKLFSKKLSPLEAAQILARKSPEVVQFIAKHTQNPTLKSLAAQEISSRAQRLQFLHTTRSFTPPAGSPIVSSSEPQPELNSTNPKEALTTRLKAWAKGLKENRNK